MNVEVKLSKLVACRKNPRRVKPERDAHRRLVASIRAHGLIEPLVVSPIEEGQYRVIAGNRRLAALREVFRGEDAKVSCVVRVAEGDAAASLSLAENFAREPMHPLDEAEAFARLASVECKGVSDIATEFGVSQTYVRQRIKLAGLAEPIKVALRADEIGVGIAEVFAAVPPERQRELWTEIGGCPRSAEQVRSMIEEAWVPVERALFDLALIDPSAVSHDLFGGKVLIERRAFLAFQQQAIEAEKARLIEEGWAHVIIARRDALPDEYHRTSLAEPAYDEATTNDLDATERRRLELEETEPTSEEHERQIIKELDALDTEEGIILGEATPIVSEATKVHGTVFLLVSPDGRVELQHRVPKRAEPGRDGEKSGTPEGTEPRALPTSNDLSDPQKAEFYTHELLAVREALGRDAHARKRLLVMVLHDKIGRDALALRRVATGAGLHAERGDEFKSSLLEMQRAHRRDVDLFADDQSVTEVEAYQRLGTLSEEQLDAMIGVLVVEFLTASLTEPTPLVELLRDELVGVGVSVRTHWTPGAGWLAGYRKSQLAHLLGELWGPAHGPSYAAASLTSKKSDLVKDVADLFRKAAEGPDSLGDAELADRVCRWVPGGGECGGVVSPNVG